VWASWTAEPHRGEEDFKAAEKVWIHPDVRGFAAALACQIRNEKSKCFNVRKASSRAQTSTPKTIS